MHISSPRKAEGETVPLLRETMTLIPVSMKGTEKSMTSDLSSLMVSDPTAMWAFFNTTCRTTTGRQRRTAQQTHAAPTILRTAKKETQQCCSSLACCDLFRYLKCYFWRKQESYCCTVSAFDPHQPASLRVCSGIFRPKYLVPRAMNKNGAQIRNTYVWLSEHEPLRIFFFFPS